MSVSGERTAITKAKRIVIKVGSSTLTRDGKLRRRAFGQLARQISNLHDRGKDIVLVSSGAIAVGSQKLNWAHPGQQRGGDGQSMDAGDHEGVRKDARR